jgi:hypothetical protein
MRGITTISGTPVGPIEPFTKRDADELKATAKFYGTTLRHIGDTAPEALDYAAEIGASRTLEHVGGLTVETVAAVEGARATGVGLYRGARALPGTFREVGGNLGIRSAVVEENAVLRRTMTDTGGFDVRRMRMNLNTPRLLRSAAAQQTAELAAEFKGVIRSTPPAPRDNVSGYSEIIRDGPGAAPKGFPGSSEGSISLSGEKPGRLNPKSIRYMQSSAKNETDGRTVLGNVEALRAGTLTAEDFPAIRVWQDVEGKVWSVDHRRLAAFRLAELSEVPVTWLSPEEAAGHMWKMSTKTDGLSIKLKLGAGKSIIVR